MNRFGKLFFVAAVVLVLLSGLGPAAYAEETAQADQAQKGEVVFLLDTSGSMKKQDKDRQAIDAIRQTAYSLPSTYCTGGL